MQSIPEDEQTVPVRQQAMQQNSDAFTIENLQASAEWPYILTDLLLKASGPVYFVLCTSIVDNFIINFVVITVLITVEFWTTKNITGRRLVGMRWWSQASADRNKSTYRFEHRVLLNPEWSAKGVVSTYFWGSTAALLAIWIAFAILYLTRPGYLILAAMGVFFVLANGWGHYQCSRWGKRELAAMRQAGFGGFVQGVTANVASTFMSVMSRV